MHRKKIRPFTTHEGSGLSGVSSQLKKVSKGEDVLDGLAMSGSAVKRSKSKVEIWVMEV